MNNDPLGIRATKATAPECAHYVSLAGLAEVLHQYRTKLRQMAKRQPLPD